MSVEKVFDEDGGKGKAGDTMQSITKSKMSKYHFWSYWCSVDGEIAFDTSVSFYRVLEQRGHVYPVIL